MKSRVLLAACLLALFGCSRTDSPEAAMSEVTLHFHFGRYGGMETLLNGQAGISNAKVDLESQHVTFELREPATLEEILRLLDVCEFFVHPGTCDTPDAPPRRE